MRVLWTVDARKLSGSDRVAVSPPIDILKSGERKPLTFKMMLTPKTNLGKGRGATSFRKCSGRGIVQLKCEAPISHENCVVQISDLRIGRNLEDAVPGPTPMLIQHDFARCCLRDLPPDWEFLKYIDEETQTLAVCLEVRMQ